MTNFIPEAAPQMRLTLRVTLLALLMTATGCATQSFEPRIDYNPEYDFNHLQRLGVQAPVAAQVAGLDAERVDSINRALAAAIVEKGITVVENAGNAQALVRWHLVGNDPSADAAYQQLSLYSCWRCGPAVDGVGMPAWQTGTLVVDVLEKETGRSLWRAEVETRLSLDAADELSREERRAAARAVLAAFPPRGE